MKGNTSEIINDPGQIQTLARELSCANDEILGIFSTSHINSINDCSYVIFQWFDK
jgi:hypothetical protein